MGKIVKNGDAYELDNLPLTSGQVVKLMHPIAGVMDVFFVWPGGDVEPKICSKADDQITVISVDFAAVEFDWPR